MTILARALEDGGDVLAESYLRSGDRLPGNDGVLRRQQTERHNACREARELPTRFGPSLHDGPLSILHLAAVKPCPLVSISARLTFRRACLAVRRALIR